MDQKLSQMYLSLLKECLLDNIYQSHDHQNTLVTADQIDNGVYWPKRAHTMIGRKRLQNIEDCAMEIFTSGIEGDFVETGVWRGGATIFMAALSKVYNQNRKVFVCDSFEGLPPPDPKYPVDIGDDHHTIDLLRVSQDEVENNFKKYDLLDQNVIFVKGFFENSLKTAPIEQIALLRLDGDMYSSTIQVLEQLYDKVVPGGYIIIDDYFIRRCRCAVDDFRKDRQITSKLFVVDWTGVYWKKE